MIAGLKYDPLKSDIWSTGVILFALLCGYLPFDDPDTQKLYNKIMSGKYEQPPYLSKDAKTLLSGMLNIDPKKRLSINDIRQSDFYRKYNNQERVFDGMIDIDHSIVEQVSKSTN